ncbi:hypothetical protein [Azoarcus olearius]|uniref:hypothetical protein n=1 Tax=Azoarcus sp. (strain BH72) TaxID=418699 RepID=UPI0012EE6C9C|nr:hypothetical protein [Azoarcus olearius]
MVNAMRRVRAVPVILAFTGFLSLVLAIAALLHQPFIKIPTEVQLRVLEREFAASVPQDKREAVMSSVLRIGGDVRALDATLTSLRRVAVCGFSVLALLCFFCSFLARHCRQLPLKPRGGPEV